MDSEEVPAGRCGFVLRSGDVGRGWIYDDFNRDTVWHERSRAVCCWRETWNDTDQCIWHADVDEKRVRELADARTAKAEKLDGAHLAGVQAEDTLSFAGCSFIGSELTNVDLSGAGLSGAALGEADLSGADLGEADLSGAALSQADLSGAALGDADLSGAALGDADLTGAALWEADLSEADLWRADLTGAALGDADLTGAALGDADLTGAALREADLSEADLWRADLTGAALWEADLTGAALREADLSEADLWRADLSEADLEDTDLRNANLEDASLTRTDLRETDLKNAQLYQTYFSDVRINSDTDFGDTCIYETPGELDDDWDEDWDATPTEAAVWTYRRLQDLHEKYALTERARHYHIKKEEMEKKRHREEGKDKKFLRGGGWKHWKQWVIYKTNGTLSKHGERPWRVIGVSGVVTLIWAFLYSLVGGVNGTVNVGGSGQVGAWTERLYFSAVTFTTLGYGDLHPATQIGRVLAASEAFLGALLMAYLVFVLGRRTNW